MRLPSWPLVPRADDHSTLLTSAGMQPQMPFFLGREQPPAPADDDLAEVLPHARHRRGRARRPPPDVLRDARQLLVRPVLQGGRDRARDEFMSGAARSSTGRASGRPSMPATRSSASARTRRRDRPLGGGRHAARSASSALPRSGELLVGRRAGPVRPGLRDLLGLGRGVRLRRPDCAPACPRCDRFLEFWNLVFMEYELHADGTLTPLPKQNVDTGMGLERLSAIAPGRPEPLCVRNGRLPDDHGAGSRPRAALPGTRTSARRRRTVILADHGRGMTFLVGDGVMPSNEGRGYVLRRIIRRAVQQARAIGLADLWRMTDVVAEQMGPWYPELVEHRARIQQVVRAEEERFSETLERGLQAVRGGRGARATSRAATPSSLRRPTGSRSS